MLPEEDVITGIAVTADTGITTGTAISLHEVVHTRGAAVGRVHPVEHPADRVVVAVDRGGHRVEGTTLSIGRQ